MKPISATSVALFVTAVLAVCQGQTQGQGQDATKVKDQGGRDVVNAVVAQIRSNCIFSEDRLFLRRIAYAMTGYGTANHTYRPGFDGGIWQVTDAMFQATKACSNSLLQSACSQISSGLSIDWTKVAYSELRKPLYSGVAAALSAQLALAGGSMPGSIADQGNYWLKMYGGTDATPFTSKADIPPPACNEKMDLAFILDASGSVSHSDFGLMLNFTSDLIGALDLSTDAVRVSDIVFSGKVIVVFGFNGYTSKADAQAKMLATPKEDWSTNTYLALDTASRVMYDASQGARQDAKKVAVLITDGKSNDGIKTTESAIKFKKKGTNVFSVGVGNFNLTELHIIASNPTCSHVQTLDSFDQIKALRTEILISSCEANQKFTVDNPASGQIGPNGTNKTTETEVPGNNQTIIAPVNCGILDIYVSTTNPKPSPAVHNNHYHSTPNHPAVLTVTETLPNGTLVYVTIVGTRLPAVAAHARNCTDYNWTMAVVPAPSVPAPDVVTVAIEGGGRSGRLLVTLNGVKGTACDDAATDDLAAVVCKELGYNVTRAALIKVSNVSSHPIVMDDAYCTGTEDTLGDCVYATVHNCDHSQDIGIDCPSDDPCENNPCQNNGQCTKVDPVTFTCQCTADYTGTTCQTYIDPCDPNPCQNGGQCTRNSATSFTCQCTADYTGTTCQTYINPCDPNPCQNGGQCTRNSATSFTCQCTADYSGDTCQTFIDPCDPNPCQNGGQCTRNSPTTFTCQCSSGYTGTTCEDVDTMCVPNPCKNGGHCVSNGTTFTCQCTVDYEGPVCEDYVDPCTASPCQNDATCVRDNATAYHCECPPGTKGANCEISDICMLSFYNKLTTFGGEVAGISVPCAYDLISMQCADLSVTLQARARTKCGTRRCYKDGVANSIAELDITVSSSRITWEAHLDDFRNIKLNPKVTGDGSLLVVTSDGSTGSIVSSDDTLSLTLSKDAGIKLMCNDMKSSAEYPTSMCGAGPGGNITIADRTKDLGFNGDYSTIVFDILTNPNIGQTSKCKDTAATLLNVCTDAAKSFEKCRRCSRDKLQRVKINCLKKCLPNKGQCKP